MIVSVEVFKVRTLRKPVSSALIMVLGLLLVIIIMAAGGLVSHWSVLEAQKPAVLPSAHWQSDVSAAGTGHWHIDSTSLSPEKREALRDDILAIRKSLSTRVSVEKNKATP